MFGWVKRKKPTHTVIKHGRYMHRPVLNRAVQLITGHQQISDLILNGQVVNNYAQRLEAGAYTMSSAKLGTTWTFFIK